MDDLNRRLQQIALDQQAIQKNLIAIRADVNTAQGQIEALRRRQAKVKRPTPEQES
jgi:hypothetical protein